MERIADYEAVSQLGAGSYGQVWLATPPDRVAVDAAQVAVKVFTRSCTQQEFAQATEELQLYAAVSSPNLVTLFDLGLWGDRLYLAMEYLAKGSLATANETGVRGHEVAAVAAASRAAHDLHQAGLVHRNIKPSNILLTDTLGAKLGDLGLAHIITPGQTVTGVGPIATVEFMDPAVVRGDRAGRASDIWSLGTSLHQVLTGQSVHGPLPTGGPLAALKHILATSPRLSQNLPEQYADIIRRCIAPDAADRYPTALALAEDLERVQGLVHA